MRAMSLLTVSVLTVSALAVSSGFAADLSEGRCACEGLRSGPTAGVVTSATGDVSILGNAGFTRIRAGNPVDYGSRIVTGPRSNANIRFGAKCSLKVGPNSDVDVSVTGDRFCARVAQAQPGGGAGEGGAGQGGAGEGGAGGGIGAEAGGLGAGFGIGAGAIALGAVGLAVGIGGIAKASSPVSP
jgi:hypothetical protein